LEERLKFIGGVLTDLKLIRIKNPQFEVRGFLV